MTYVGRSVFDCRELPPRQSRRVRDPVAAIRAYERNYVAAFLGNEDYDDELRMTALQELEYFHNKYRALRGTVQAFLKRRIRALKAVPHLKTFGLTRAELTASGMRIKRACLARFTEDDLYDVRILQMFLERKQPDIGALNLIEEHATAYKELGLPYEDLVDGGPTIGLFDLIRADRVVNETTPPSDRRAPA